MKKFTFPLHRALEWRRTQAHVEEAKLERLYAEIRGFDARQAALGEQRAEAEKAVLAGASSTGAELEALDTFQRFTAAEQVRLEGQRVECRQRIAVQIDVVAAKRRDVRLLERLKERRLKQWISELDREVDAQAEEAFLAKWNAVP